MFVTVHHNNKRHNIKEEFPKIFQDKMDERYTDINTYIYTILKSTKLNK